MMDIDGDGSGEGRHFDADGAVQSSVPPCASHLYEVAGGDGGGTTVGNYQMSRNGMEFRIRDLSKEAKALNADH